MRRFILTIVCCVLLAGCHSRSAQIALIPAAVEDCGDATQPVAMSVHWDASKAKPEAGIKIWLSNQPVPFHAGVFDPPFGTIWIEAGASGTETTGPWVFPGTTFTLTDAKSGSVLLQMRVPSRACGRGQNHETEPTANSATSKTG